MIIGAVCGEEYWKSINATGQVLGGASGLDMVNITAGSKRYTERLVIG